MDQLARVVAELRAETAADNTAVLALARTLDPGLTKTFNPRQLRDRHGKWTSGGGGSFRQRLAVNAFDNHGPSRVAALPPPKPLSPGQGQPLSSAEPAERLRALDALDQLDAAMSDPGNRHGTLRREVDRDAVRILMVSNLARLSPTDGQYQITAMGRSVAAHHADDIRRQARDEMEKPGGPKPASDGKTYRQHFQEYLAERYPLDTEAGGEQAADEERKNLRPVLRAAKTGAAVGSVGIMALAALGAANAAKIDPELNEFYRQMGVYNRERARRNPNPPKPKPRPDYHQRARRKTGTARVDGRRVRVEYGPAGSFTHEL